MLYKYSLPTSASFTGKGLLGYSFGPLRQKDVDVYYIEVAKGHDTFMVSKKITRTYYVLGGCGYFTIEGRRYDVSPGMLVEVPPKAEYCYSGQMTLLAFCRPGWFSANDTHTKWNPDVVGMDRACAIDRGTWITRFAKARFFGKSPLNLYLRFNERIWCHLPAFLHNLAPARWYGTFLHHLVRIQSVRGQAFSTLFLRNRPELDLIRRLVDRKGAGETVRVAVLGCSIGAEAYSIAWTIRSARPDLKLVLSGMDISKQAVEVAKAGLYSLAAPRLSGTNIVEGMTTEEVDELFHRRGEVLAVKDWIKEGINWHVGDAGERGVFDVLGSQDMVVANNFLCHMDPPEADRCLRNIARFVAAHGYLFVSGIDLEVRTKAACDLGWTPLQESLEQIHEGDRWLRRAWPFQYGGLEPLNKRRRDWRTRYAAAFQLIPKRAVKLSNDEAVMVDDEAVPHQTV